MGPKPIPVFDPGVEAVRVWSMYGRDDPKPLRSIAGRGEAIELLPGMEEEWEKTTPSSPGLGSVLKCQGHINVRNSV